MKSKASKQNKPLINQAIFEFLNTYKYLKNNRRFLDKYYKLEYHYSIVWMIYLYMSLSVKAKKFFYLLTGL